MDPDPTSFDRGGTRAGAGSRSSVPLPSQLTVMTPASSMALRTVAEADDAESFLSDGLATVPPRFSPHWPSQAGGQIGPQAGHAVFMHLNTAAGAQPQAGGGCGDFNQDAEEPAFDDEMPVCHNGESEFVSPASIRDQSPRTEFSVPQDRPPNRAERRAGDTDTAEEPQIDRFSRRAGEVAMMRESSRGATEEFFIGDDVPNDGLTTARNISRARAAGGDLWSRNLTSAQGNPSAPLAVVAARAVTEEAASPRGSRGLVASLWQTRAGGQGEDVANDPFDIGGIPEEPKVFDKGYGRAGNECVPSTPRAASLGRPARSPPRRFPGPPSLDALETFDSSGVHQLALPSPTAPSSRPDHRPLLQLPNRQNAVDWKADLETPADFVGFDRGDRRALPSREEPPGIQGRFGPPLPSTPGVVAAKSSFGAVRSMPRAGGMPLPLQQTSDDLFSTTPRAHNACAHGNPNAPSSPHCWSEATDNNATRTPVARHYIGDAEAIRTEGHGMWDSDETSLAMPGSTTGMPELPDDLPSDFNRFMTRAGEEPPPLAVSAYAAPPFQAGSDWRASSVSPSSSPVSAALDASSMFAAREGSRSPILRRAGSLKRLPVMPKFDLLRESVPTSPKPTDLLVSTGDAGGADLAFDLPDEPAFDFGMQRAGKGGKRAVLEDLVPGADSAGGSGGFPLRAQARLAPLPHFAPPMRAVTTCPDLPPRVAAVGPFSSRLFGAGGAQSSNKSDLELGELEAIAPDVNDAFRMGLDRAPGGDVEADIPQFDEQALGSSVEATMPDFDGGQEEVPVSSHALPDSDARAPQALPPRLAPMPLG